MIIVSFLTVSTAPSSSYAKPNEKLVSKSEKSSEVPSVLKNLKNFREFIPSSATTKDVVSSSPATVTKPKVVSITPESSPANQRSKPQLPKQAVPFKPLPKPSIVFDRPVTSVGSTKTTQSNTVYVPPLPRPPPPTSLVPRYLFPSHPIPPQNANQNFMPPQYMPSVAPSSLPPFAPQIHWIPVPVPVYIPVPSMTDDEFTIAGSQVISSMANGFGERPFQWQQNNFMQQSSFSYGQPKAPVSVSTNTESIDDGSSDEKPTVNEQSAGDIIRNEFYKQAATTSSSKWSNGTKGPNGGNSSKPAPGSQHPSTPTRATASYAFQQSSPFQVPEPKSVENPLLPYKQTFK